MHKTGGARIIIPAIMVGALHAMLATWATSQPILALLCNQYCLFRVSRDREVLVNKSWSPLNNGIRSAVHHLVQVVTVRLVSTDLGLQGLQ